MSNRALKWVYEQTVGSGPRKSVLVSLAEQADEKTLECYPGQLATSRRCEFGVRTVRREIAALEADGYISRRMRFDKDGHRTSDYYTVNLDRPAQPPATQAAGQSGRRSERPRPPATQAATTGQSGQVTIREPSVEPSVSGRAQVRDPATKDNAAKTNGTRGHRLPDGWCPTEADIAWQREEGVSDEFARRETEKFRDFWLAKAGAAARKIDWSRTWKNWIRTASERSMPSTVGAPQPIERRPAW